MFEKYLVPAEGPAATQTAMASNVGNVAAEPARSNSASRVKKRAKAARPAARMRDNFAAAQLDRRWERRAARRGGLFFFGRFARAE